MPTRPPGTPDIDLTTANSFGEINGAVFMTGSLQPAGSGTFNSFVQIQHNGFEQGYNSDHAPQFDEKNSHPHNHSILLADVPIVFGDGSNGTTDGVAYREFHLDLNDANGGGKPYISLDALQLWQEESGNLTGFTPGTGFSGAHTNYLAYNLDAGGNHWIGLNDSLSHGSGQSDVRVLIPDSFFINDTAHRYVTLYSALGQQAGWEADGGFEEWGLNNASGGAVSSLVVHKTATVPGGTADTAGEVISYAISVGNVGNQTLTGITVTDPSVSNLAAVLSSGFNIGDVNHDGNLNAGETWQYTASHTVTQIDIDGNGGGDGTIENTVTADSAQTNPVSATAFVAVEQRPTLNVTKAPDVTSVNAAGNVINYTVNVQNVGNVTQGDPVVTDPQFTVVTPIVNLDTPILGTQPFTIPVLVGDYNIGDTNQNGIQDPGETFTFVNIGDTNQNGVQDPGETFQFANAGDINHNGSIDPGETFQYYNAGDTNQNGVEDPGETFQFIVSHQIAGVDANHDGFNDGDANHDGFFNAGETWQYAVSYTVIQADIDNGGVVNPALTHNNTATATTAQGAEASASASVAIHQNPHLMLTKNATVPGGTADHAGEVISYTISVVNDGNMTLTGLAVSDPSVSNLAAVTSGGFNVGDTDTDGKVDLGETWQYTASHTVTQAEMDAGTSISNTASAHTLQNANASGGASIAVEQHPSVTLVKTATVPGGTADTAGEVISYTIAATNNGNVSLTGVAVSDPSVTDLAAVLSGSFNSGDTNTDGKLSVGETWHYTASHTVTQSDIDTNGGGDGTIDNTASVATTQGASASGSASVTVVQPPPVVTLTIDDNAHISQFVDTGPMGPDAGGDLIQFFFQVTNRTSNTLTSFTVTDTQGDIPGSLQNPVPSSLGPLGVYGTTFNHFLTATDVSHGYVDDDVTASAVDPSSVLQTATLHFHFLL